jgi:hypothetical protein
LQDEAEIFVEQDSGRESLKSGHLRMAACNIPFGAVVEAILIRSVVFTPGFRADGGLMGHIRHRLNQQFPLGST